MSRRFLANLACSCWPPLAAAIGAISSYRLLSASFTTPHLEQTSSIEGWFTTFGLATISILCLGFLIWWLSAIIIGFLMVLRALAKGQDTVQLPDWMPKAVKGSVTGLLGISVIATPSFALEATADHAPFSSTTSVSAPTEIGAVSLPGNQPPSPLFTDVTPTPQAALEPQTTVVNLTAQRYIPLSPLFAAPSQTNHLDADTESPSHNQEDTTGVTSYTVQQGDTLWSIAEHHLPETATGSEVLDLVHQIHQENIKALPTLDTFIFPGQTLHLPLPISTQ